MNFTSQLIGTPISNYNYEPEYDNKQEIIERNDDINNIQNNKPPPYTRYKTDNQNNKSNNTRIC